MDLKSLIELNNSYPAWAKVVFVVCVVIVVVVLLFAKKPTAELSRSSSASDPAASTINESRASDGRKADSVGGTSEIRPWIVTESLKLKEPITLRGDYFFLNLVITLRNSGNSTARQVYASVRLSTMEVARVNEAWNTVVEDYRREDATRSAESNKAKGTTIPFGYVIAPGQSATEPYGCGGPSTDPDSPTVEQIRGGAFFVFGYLEYLDQHGGKHHTRFCFIPDGDSVRPWDLSTFLSYAGYQDAD